MSNNFETLTVEDVMLRERNDGTGEFPVVIIAGISLNLSATGNQSFTKRRVSLPLNGFTVEEAKQAFPKGMKLQGFKIQQYEVDPYEWTTPEGEVRTDNVRYRLVDLRQPAEPPVNTTSEPQSTREPVEQQKPKAPAPQEVGAEEA